MSHATLDRILESHAIPATDRPPFCALIECGVIMQPGFTRKLRRGKHKACYEAILLELSRPTIAEHSLECAAC